MSIEGKPLDEEQKKMMKEAFPKQKFLSQVSDKACKCIDSISTTNKNAKENSVEVKKCIDKEVIGYQSALTILKTVDVKENEKATLTIYTNPESNEYKKYYFEIEKQLMDSCQVIKNVVGMNNKLNKKSLSDNIQAKREYNIGINYFKANDYANALQYFKKAVEIDPEFVFAWDNLGLCHRKLGNFDAAIEAYKKSIKLDPAGVMPRQNIAYAYIGKKDYKKAIDCYNDLAKLDKNDPEIFYGIGAIYFEHLKDYEKALDNMCKAYNLYIAQNSPYRTDAEKIIQSICNELKQQGKEGTFNTILKANNISQN